MASLDEWRIYYEISIDGERVTRRLFVWAHTQADARRYFWFGPIGPGVCPRIKAVSRPAE